MLSDLYARLLPSTEHCAVPSVPSWNNILHGENAQAPQTLQPRKTVKTHSSFFFLKEIKDLFF